jgi:hypothetical protein
MRTYQRYCFCFSALVLLIFICSSPAYAKKWNVYPSMSRVAIQAVIGTAVDGDVIYFNQGIYDFSAAPLNFSFKGEGALQIIDKSLAIKGAPGAIIKGAPVEYEVDPNNPYITWMKGINCFWIVNSDSKKDVSFDGLTFQTFMNGISAVNPNGEPYNAIYYPNLRNLVVKNCTFIDIKRNGISAAGVQGDITITYNSINGDRSSSRFGMYIDWYFEPGNVEWQPTNTLVTVKDNSIWGFYWGIYTLRPSNMLIRDNAVSNAQIGIYFNAGLKNSAMIKNNTFSKLNSGIIISGYEYPLNGVPFQEPAKGIELKYNLFSNIQNMGISIYGNLAYSNSIVYNTFNIDWGSAIYSEGYNNEYRNNVIQGNGDYAVVLSGYDGSAGGEAYGAHNEFFKNNSILGFTPQYSHYFLDANTYDNSVIGIESETATFIDNGINNFFKFVYPIVSPASTTTLLSLDSPKAQNEPQKRAEPI